MAQGIVLPIITENGRMKKLSGDNYIGQLIKTAMLSGDSENPFQELGLGEFMIFDLNDGITTAEIRTRVIKVMESLEQDQLARIDNPLTDLTFEEDGEVLKMKLFYRNMETQEREEIEVPIPGGN